MPDDLSGSLPGDSGLAPGGGGAPDNTPAPITLTDDARFIPPGGKDAVTWKDYSSGFVSKADLTRMRQQDTATLERERAAIRRSADTLAQQLTQRHQGSQQHAPAADPFAELEGMPYVDGKAAATLARQIVQQGIGPVFQQAQRLANENQLLSQRLQRLEQGVGTLSGQRAESEFNSRIDATISDLGYAGNETAREIARDIWHSYTGWETDPNAFPQMVKGRIEQVQAMFRERDNKRVAEARAQTRPGQGPPMAVRRAGKPAASGLESAEKLADRLWQGLQPTQT